MRVAVTGGTGFVGSHTVAALVGAGHEIRMLVRNRAKVGPALDPLGVDRSAVEVFDGDITDAASVERVLAGADACLHAAAVVATRRKHMAEVEATNLAGARNVLGRAVAEGCDPIVHVSSISAVFPTDAGVLHADLPVARPKSIYGQTKADSEQFARDLQTLGHPVVIVYPGGVIGPHDAGLNASAQGIARSLRSGFVPRVRQGGSALVDVRDLARVHERLLRSGLGPRRYMAGGRFLDWDEFHEVLVAVTGRDFRTPRLPPWVLMAIGRLGDVVARLTPIEPTIDYETAYYMTHLIPTDDRAVRDELGVSWRPTIESVRDMLEWLVAAGHLPAEDAGSARI